MSLRTETGAGETYMAKTAKIGLAGPHDPGQGQDIHRNGTSREQDPAAAFDGRPSGDDIIDQQHPLPCDKLPPPARKFESPLHIAATTKATEVALLLGGLAAPQQIGRQRPVSEPCQGLGQ